MRRRIVLVAVGLMLLGGLLAVDRVGRKPEARHHWQVEVGRPQAWDEAMFQRCVDDPAVDEALSQQSLPPASTTASVTGTADDLRRVVECFRKLDAPVTSRRV